MEKRTVLDQIEIKSDGTIFIRLFKQVVDGDSVLFSEPHRSALEPPVAVDDHTRVVSEHLEAMGWPAISVEDAARLDAHAQVARTPEVVEAFKAVQLTNQIKTILT